MCIDTIQYSTLHQATTHYFINNDGWNNGCDKNRRTVASVSRSYCPCTRIIGYCVVLTIIKVLTSIIVCTSITLQCTERVWLCDCVTVWMYCLCSKNESYSYLIVCASLYFESWSSTAPHLTPETKTFVSTILHLWNKDSFPAPHGTTRPKRIVLFARNNPPKSSKMSKPKETQNQKDLRIKFASVKR